MPKAAPVSACTEPGAASFWVFGKVYKIQFFRKTCIRKKRRRQAFYRKQTIRKLERYTFCTQEANHAFETAHRSYPVGGAGGRRPHRVQLGGIFGKQRLLQQLPAAASSSQPFSRTSSSLPAARDLARPSHPARADNAVNSMGRSPAARSGSITPAGWPLTVQNNEDPRPRRLDPRVASS